MAGNSRHAGGGIIQSHRHERRRKGLRNKIRRAIYGAILWLGHTHAMAADHGLRTPGPHRPLNVYLSFSPDKARPAADGNAYRVGVEVDDPRLSPAYNVLLHRFGLRRSLHRIADLRRGASFDVDIPRAGRLHLDLQPQQLGTDTDGLRFTNRSGIGLLREFASAWSLGGSLDVEQARSYEGIPLGARKLVFAPQLVLDATRSLGFPGNAIITLQHADWRQADIGPVSSEQVWQVSLHWHF